MSIFNTRNKCRVTTGLFSTLTPEQCAEAQTKFAKEQESAAKKEKAKRDSLNKETKQKKRPTPLQAKTRQANADNKLVRPFVKTKTSLVIPIFDKPAEYHLENNEIVWDSEPTKIIYTGPEKFGLQSVGISQPVEIQVLSIKGSPLRSDEKNGIGRA